MIVHTDEKPFPCPDPNCTLMFKTEVNAKNHHSQKHLGKLKYPCRHCSASYYQSKDRSAHMMSLHPKEYEEHLEKYKFFWKENRDMYQKKE